MKKFNYSGHKQIRRKLIPNTLIELYNVVILSFEKKNWKLFDGLEKKILIIRIGKECWKFSKRKFQLCAPFGQTHSSRRVDHNQVQV